MKRTLVLVGATAMLACPAVSYAQWSDNFDSYFSGSPIHGVGGWKGWDNNPAAGANVSSVQAHSGANSIAIVGGADLIQEHVGDTGPPAPGSTGTWRYTTWQYIPAGMTGDSYFINQNVYNDGGPYEWSVQLGFDSATGEFHCDCGGVGGTPSDPYISGQWVEISYLVSWDNDWCQLYYNGVLLDDPALPGSGYAWTLGVFGNDTTGVLNIGATDLFANSASVVYYDTMSIAVAVAGGSGSCCQEDTEVCSDGVNDIDCLDSNLRWEENVLCDDLDPVCGAQPIGACCVGADNDTMSCIGDITEAECGAFNTPPSQISLWRTAESCGGGFDCPPILDPECPDPNIFCQVSDSEGQAAVNGVSDDVRPLLRYDDYSVTGVGTSVVGGMRFWGINLLDNFSGTCDESPTTFDIVFYPDDAGSPDKLNPACQYLSVQPTQTPTNSLVTSLDANLQQYDIDLEAVDTCCDLQDGWVSIQGTDPTPPDANGGPCTWLWTSSGGPTGGSSILDFQDGGVTPDTIETFNLSLALTAGTGPCACVPGPFLQQDYDQNCEVDFTDLGIFLGPWTGTGVQYAGCSLPGGPFNDMDFDQNCEVDFTDLGIFLGPWTGTGVQYAGCQLCP